jgi:hypothetical protein
VVLITEMLEICIQTSYDQSVQLILKSYLPVVYDTLLIWFRGFRGEDLNVKVYNVRRTPSDVKSSHGLWPGKLKKDNGDIMDMI